MRIDIVTIFPEFFDVLDRWANHDLFTRDGESWSPLFTPQ